MQNLPTAPSKYNGRPFYSLALASTISVFQFDKSSSTQTDIHIPQINTEKNFAHVTDTLYICDSFITENTLCDDDTPVIVDSEVQTIQTGNFLEDKETQTDITLDQQIFFTSIFTDNFENQNEGSNQFCQTLVTGDLK